MNLPFPFGSHHECGYYCVPAEGVHALRMVAPSLAAMTHEATQWQIHNVSDGALELLRVWPAPEAEYVVTPGWVGGITRQGGGDTTGYVPGLVLVRIRHFRRGAGPRA